MIKKNAVSFCLFLFMFFGPVVLRAQKYVQKTDLPTIYIETVNNKPIESKEDYVDATLYYVDETGVKTYDKLGVRGRGNSTWNLEKKPYRIKFADKQAFMGPDRAKAKSWVLLANFGDKTLLRNAVAACIGDFAGQPFTAGTQFVDFVLNGKYLGNYQLSDQMEVKKKRVDIDEQDEIPAEDANITGGYFLEVDGFAYSEPVYYRTNRGVMVTVKSPDEEVIVPRQLEYIKNHMQLFEDALFSSDFADSEKGYRPYVDSLTLASWYISTELTANVDGFWSTYMYKKKDDQKFYWGPLWDYDIAFNNCNRAGDVSECLMRDRGFEENLTKQWVLQMWKDPWFVRLINRTWQDCVKRGIEEHVMNYIDSMALVIDRSQAMNFQKWPIDRRDYNEIVLFSTYQEGVDYLKSFVHTHCAFLTKVFAQAAEAIEDPTPVFIADKNFYYRICNKGTGNAIDVLEGQEKICTWEMSCEKQSQQWDILPIGDYYQLINRENGMALYDCALKEGDSYQIGTQLELRKRNNTQTRQQWSFVPVNTGSSYVIVNRQTQLALNNAGGSAENGNSVLSWTNNSENSLKDTRQWRVEKDELKEGNAVQSPEREMQYWVLYNPETKQLHFESSDRAQLGGYASIYTTGGACVMQFKIDETADLSTFGKGVYMLVWMDKDIKRTVKVAVE